MSQRSLLSRVLKPSRMRRRRRRVKSLSEVVGKLADGAEAELPTPSWIAPPPPADAGAWLAAQASNARQLEAENARLKRMAGDLMLQTEILRATMRRRVRDDSLTAGS